jgi:hypothetical protein
MELAKDALNQTFKLNVLHFSSGFDKNQNSKYI